MVPTLQGLDGRIADRRQGAAPTLGRTRAPRLVVQYLYVHEQGDAYLYPSSRARGGPERLACRYLECVLVQAGSLRLRGADCELALVTNLLDRDLTGHIGRLVERIQAMGVELIHSDYGHRPPGDDVYFASSRYVFDAILAATSEHDPERRVWMTDVDCVWVDPSLAFAATPSSPAIGSVVIEYPSDWLIAGLSPNKLADIARWLGAPERPLRCIGGELLTGTARDLRALVRCCRELDEELAERGIALATEEHLLSVAGMLGAVRFEDLSNVASRIWTGPRHGAPAHEDPAALGIWHLPSEKGLGFRRTARELASGRGEQLVGDLEVPWRAMRRFNVGGAGLARRLRDDGWLASQHALDRLEQAAAPLRRLGRRPAG
jgi:hypothetical protein